MSDHGEWVKDQERYEDGCRSDAAPHVLGIPDEWKMPIPRLAEDTPPAAPARDPLAAVIQANLSSHRAPSPAAHADALAKIVREQLAAELVPLLVDHTCCHDSRGYAAMCDCNHGPYTRDADGNRLKDEKPITLYAEHIASLVRRQQSPPGGEV